MTSPAFWRLVPLLVATTMAATVGCAPRASVDPEPYRPLVADALAALQPLLPGMEWKAFDEGEHYRDPHGGCWLELGGNGTSPTGVWKYDERHVLSELNRALERHDFPPQRDLRWGGGQLVVDSRDGQQVEFYAALSSSRVMLLVRVPAARADCG